MERHLDVELAQLRAQLLSMAGLVEGCTLKHHVASE